MKRWLTISALTGMILMFNSIAMAQGNRDDDDDDDQDNYALTVGVGLVEPADEVETYLMAALRIRVGGRDGDSSRGRRQGEGIDGYLEPEIGYWESSDDAIPGSDLLVGVNLIGVVPFGNVDSFFGVGAGVHFIDASLLEGDPRADGSESQFGANAQFGIDIYFGESWSAFGAGRFDLVQGSEDSLQSKVYLGLRTRF